MGWSRGPEIAEWVWSEVKEFIPPEHHQKVAKKIVKIFNYHDADDWAEAESLSKAAGLVNEDGDWIKVDEDEKADKADEADEADDGDDARHYST